MRTTTFIAILLLMIPITSATADVQKDIEQLNQEILKGAQDQRITFTSVLSRFSFFRNLFETSSERDNAEIIQLLLQRQQKMRQLLSEGDGEGILRTAFTEEQRSQLPPEAHSFVEQPITDEGLVGITVEDNFIEGTSKELYTLHSFNRRKVYDLLINQDDETKFHANTYQKIKGFQLDSTIVAQPTEIVAATSVQFSPSQRSEHALVEISSTTCTDSDGGIATRQQGFATGTYEGTRITRATDFCMAAEDDTLLLQEWFCTEEGLLARNPQVCPNGCNNGRCCKSGENCPTTLSLTRSEILGEQKTIVFLMNFENNLAQPVTKDQAHELVFAENPSTDSINKYIREVSHGKSWLNGITIDWQTLSPFTEKCDENIVEILRQQHARHDLTQYERAVVVYNHACRGNVAGRGTVGKQPFFFDDTIHWMSVSRMFGPNQIADGTGAHELGHNFGMGHANYYDCGGDSIGKNCESTEYGDLFSIMGRSGLKGYHNAPHQELIGWLDEGEIIETALPGTYTLSPIEMETNNPATLKIPLKDDRYYHIEYRRPLGYDGILGAQYGTNPFDGALIRLAIPEDGYLKTHLVDTHPDNNALTAALGLGQEFHDEENSFTITTQSLTENSLVLRIGGSLPADFTGDGRVDMADFLQFRECFATPQQTGTEFTVSEGDILTYNGLNLMVVQITEQEAVVVFHNGNIAVIQESQTKQLNTLDITNIETTLNTNDHTLSSARVSIRPRGTTTSNCAFADLDDDGDVDLEDYQQFRNSITDLSFTIPELNCREIQDCTFNYPGHTCELTNSLTNVIGGTCTLTQTRCTDSDRGLVFTEQGVTEGIHHTTQSYVVVRDTCQNNLLKEYYCSTNQNAGQETVREHQRLCAHGCEEGICLPETTVLPLRLIASLPLNNSIDPLQEAIAGKLIQFAYDQPLINALVIVSTPTHSLIPVTTSIQGNVLTVRFTQQQPTGEWIHILGRVTAQNGQQSLISHRSANLPADVNQNGKVDIKDATQFGQEMQTQQNPRLTDINRDGRITIQDATAFGELYDKWQGTELPA